MTSGDLSPARQMYLMAFPKLKLRCSTISMHSVPVGWDV
jgi:hypothetical protein